LESSGQAILDKFQVKAHDVRALASSWALLNNALLNEVLSAGFWRGVYFKNLGFYNNKYVTMINSE
jgi:hypothetical protein